MTINFTSLSTADLATIAAAQSVCVRNEIAVFSAADLAGLLDEVAARLSSSEPDLAGIARRIGWQGGKLSTIKAMRDTNACSLKEAKDTVEAVFPVECDEAAQQHIRVPAGTVLSPDVSRNEVRHAYPPR